MPNKFYSLLLAIVLAAPTALHAQQPEDTGAIGGDAPAAPALLTEEVIVVGTVVAVGLALVIGDGDSSSSTPSTP